MVTRAGDERGTVIRMLLRLVLSAGGVLGVVLGVVASARWPTPWIIGPTVVMLAAVLATQAWRDSEARLRLAELMLVGAASWAIVATGLAASADLSVVAAWRGTVSFSALLAVGYAVFVPNTVTRAAPVVVVAGSLPALSYGLFAWRDPVAAEAIHAGGVAGPVGLLVVAVTLGLAAVALMTKLRNLAIESRDGDMYRLIEQIGEGGMGEIWRAEHRRLARDTAIKIIRPDVMGADADKSKAVLYRFEQEARATARLRSPHTVEVYDAGTTSDGTFYYVMEYLVGLDLEQVVTRHGPIEPARAIYLLIQACESLADAHAHGLIHRDVKPANIYVARQGGSYDHVKVLDFGLAKPVDRQDDSADVSAEGEVVGTPAFMAPEVIRGGAIDRRADVYALGCVAYWMLAGVHVFPAERAIEAAIAHVTETPVPVSERAQGPIPPDLERVVMRCLEKDPADRFDSCEELAAALRSVELGQRWTPDEAARWWNHAA